MAAREPEISELILGWRVNADLEPEYWLTPGAKAGYQSPAHLFSVRTDSMATHTAIIAQSGSGKSFFLGRLIEEIIIASKARVLILDPNSDFRRIAEIAGRDLWTDAKYGGGEKKALPHEKTRDEFEANSNWSNLAIRVRTGTPSDVADELLQVSWLSVSTDFLAEDVKDPMLHSDLYNCHSLVKSLGVLLRLKFKATQIAPDIIEEAESLFGLIKSTGQNKNDLRERLEYRYSPNKILSRTGPLEEKVYFNNEGISTSMVERLSKSFVNTCLILSANYVSDDIQRFYFGKAREYQNAGILKSKIDEDLWNDSEIVKRIDVVDLPSLADRNTRLLALSAVLETEWDRARSSWANALEGPPSDDKRVPTFIVLDEAHNLIPQKPRSKADAALREQFRTLAAEGRKFGLFLILVSQRPDKLDFLVLSECQNKAIMKLGSNSVLKTTKRMLGLEDVDADVLNQCLKFQTGRVLFLGPWSRNKPQVAFAAARRTIEGGRDLQAKHWATPIVEATKK